MKGWRTQVWNVLGLIAIGAIFQDWIIPPEGRIEALAVHGLIWGSGNIGLRVITNTPIGKKQ